MQFIENIKDKKFIFLSILLFIYLILNFFDGERGLISYYDKQKKLENLILEKQIIISKLNDVRKKNDLLTNNIDLDYLEILYRNKFMLGKPSEKVFYK